MNKLFRMITSALIIGMLMSPAMAAEMSNHPSAINNRYDLSVISEEETELQDTGTNVVEKQAQYVNVVKRVVANIDVAPFSLTATTNGDGALVYKSSDENVVTVSKKGRVTVQGLGKATISVYAKETDRFSKSETVNVSVVVNKAVQYIRVDEANLVFRASDVKKRSQKQNIYAISAGEKSYRKLSGSNCLTINKKTGMVAVKKGTKAGTYKMKVRIKAKETDFYAAGSVTTTVKVSVASDKNLVDKYCSALVKNYTTKDMSVVMKLANLSSKFTFDYNYGNVYDVNDVVSKKTGTCYSAGKVLAKAVEKLGYKATVRSAIKDDMSRYPSGVIFYADHYNVKVVANGKTYYIDATPDSGMVYVSSSKKPLFYANLFQGVVIAPKK